MRNGLKGRTSIVFLLAGSLLAPSAIAGQMVVKLTADRDSVSVLHDGNMVEITRNQNTESLIDPMWAKTSRQCPPFCIEPTTPVPGVQLFTEIDVFDFMEQKVNTGKGLIIDARLPDWYLRGTIPGSTNIPFTVFQRDPHDPKLKAAFDLLGVRPRGAVNMFTQLGDKILGNGDKTETWDFSAARELVLWCNGPWCGQSPHAIRALIKQGYPVSKIHYYRGGMQSWQVLGLTTVMPSERSVLFPEAGGN